MTYDAIVVGGGAAALTSALYLGRYNVETLLLTDMFGGQTAIAGTIENYPGFDEINGSELIGKMKQKVESLETVTILAQEKVVKVESATGLFKVTTAKGEYEGKTVLIAAGKRHRELGIEDEESLIGKGLSYCATCDGTFAKDKDVAVIGGGYAATEAVLILEKLSRSVTLVNIGQELSGETVTLEKIGTSSKIKILKNAETKEISTTENVVSGVKYLDKQTNETKTLPVQMVFVEIGQVPNSEEFKGLVDLNETGEIITNGKTCQTSTAGIYAAGDITDTPAKQTIVACGEGAKAAIAINQYLHKNIS